MTVPCAYCGEDTLDAHQFEVCASCCECREDLAGEVLVIAEGITDIADSLPADRVEWLPLCAHALALTQLAARLSRTGGGGAR